MGRSTSGRYGVPYPTCRDPSPVHGYFYEAAHRDVHLSRTFRTPKTRSLPSLCTHGGSFLGELTETSHASLDGTEATEHDANTAVPDAAETGAPPPPATYARAAKASASVHHSGSVKAHRRHLQKPYSREDLDDARQPAATRGKAAEDAIREPEPAEEENESVSFSTPGFIPVVDFDGIPPFSDSDEIETARGLPGCVRRRAGRRVRRRAVV